MSEHKYIGITDRGTRKPEGGEEYRRTSTLVIEDDGTLLVLGNLPHGYVFGFTSIEDAKKMKAVAERYLSEQGIENADDVLMINGEAYPIGCYAENSRGRYIGELVQKLAVQAGWEGECAFSGHVDYDEATDEAEEYLNTLVPEGYYFGTLEHTGDWGLWIIEGNTGLQCEL